MTLAWKRVGYLVVVGQAAFVAQPLRCEGLPRPRGKVAPARVRERLRRRVAVERWPQEARAPCHRVCSDVCLCLWFLLPWPAPCLWPLSPPQGFK